MIHPRNVFRDRLAAAGFAVNLMWSGKTGTALHKYDDVFCYAVYAPSGALLTSIVLREMDGGYCTYFANESVAADGDVDRLVQMIEDRSQVSA